MHKFSAGSETPFGDQNLVLFRDDEGFYATSSTCTHLGCTVAYWAITIGSNIANSPRELTDAIGSTLTSVQVQDRLPKVETRM